MTVCANNGSFPANNTEELKTALNAACGEIWLGEGEDTYPCIAILCCEDGASLNYFASEGGEMFVSVGNRLLRGTLDVNIDGEMYQIERSQIIPYDKVLPCAMEFMRNYALPKSISWDKL